MLLDNDRLRLGAKSEPTATPAPADGHCSSCDTELTLLGTLPAIRLRSAITVYHCPVCNRVTSREG